MVNTELLEAKIKESGKSKSYLCRKLGITLQTFRRKITNKVEFVLTEVERLCLELGIKSLSEKERIFFANIVDKNDNTKGE